MKQNDLKEASGVLRPVVAALAQTALDAATLAAADLRQATGRLAAGAEAAILDGTFGTDLATCFDAARAAGASFERIAAIRASVEALAPASSAAQTVAAASIQLALACQCRIVADTDFASRNQVDAWRAVLDLAFEGAIDAASNDFDQAAMTALTSLRAAVMRDLGARARPLPQLLSYSFSRRESALVIATRLYGDGGRYAEIIAENSPVHPLFMPASGRALSR